jgi:hypothetical protein
LAVTPASRVIIGAPEATRYVQFLSVRRPISSITSAGTTTNMFDYAEGFIGNRTTIQSPITSSIFYSGTLLPSPQDEGWNYAISKPLFQIFVGLPGEFIISGTFSLGSGLIDHNQKMTVAAIAMADMKVWAHRS